MGKLHAHCLPSLTRCLHWRSVIHAQSPPAAISTKSYGVVAGRKVHPGLKQNCPFIWKHPRCLGRDPLASQSLVRWCRAKPIAARGYTLSGLKARMRLVALSVRCQNAIGWSDPSELLDEVVTEGVINIWRAHQYPSMKENNRNLWSKDEGRGGRKREDNAEACE